MFARQTGKDSRPRGVYLNSAPWKGRAMRGTGSIARSACVRYARVWYCGALFPNGTALGHETVGAVLPGLMLLEAEYRGLGACKAGSRLLVWRNSAIPGSCMHLPLWLLFQDDHAVGFKPQSKKSSPGKASCSIDRARPAEIDRQTRSRAVPGVLSVSSSAMKSASSSETFFFSVAAFPERPRHRIQATERKEVTERNVLSRQPIAPL
jgi:hypothetical protein